MINPIQSNYEYMMKNYGVDCLINGQDNAICFLKDINEIDSVDKKYLFVERNKVKMGDTLKIEGINYLVIGDRQNYDYEIYHRFVIVKCIHSINFIVDEEIYSTPAYIIEKSQRVLVNTTISTFEGDLSVYIQANDKTDLVALNNRFIKFKSAWKIVSIVELEENLFHILAERDSTAPDDDLINEIPSGLPVYTIEFDSSDIEVNKDSIVQLTPIVKKDGEIVSVQLTYESLNTDIVTIDESGLITGINVGATQINISYKRVTSSVNISCIEQEVITYEILGASNIYDYDPPQTYTGNKYVNGVLSASTWTFTVDTTQVTSPAPSTKYAFTVVDANHCTIENKGYVYRLEVVGSCEGNEIRKLVTLKGAF